MPVHLHKTPYHKVCVEVCVKVQQGWLALHQVGSDEGLMGSWVLKQSAAQQSHSLHREQNEAPSDQTLLVIIHSQQAFTELMHICLHATDRVALCSLGMTLNISVGKVTARGD